MRETVIPSAALFHASLLTHHARQPPEKPARTPDTLLRVMTPSDLKQRLADLGIELPSVSGPFGAYVPAKRVGNLVYTAGTLPMEHDKLLAVGQVPSRCSPDRARAAARQCVINALASVQGLGIELNHISGV